MQKKQYGWGLVGILPFLAVIAPASANLNCAAAMDCSSQGYTMKAEDCGEGLKVLCPTDMTKAFCKKKPLEAPLPILYGDGTVSKVVLTAKTPIGIVFNEADKLAIALTDVKQDGTAGTESMYWSDTIWNTGLEECYITGYDTATCKGDGRTNTDIILASLCTPYECNTVYTAPAVNKFTPVGCSKSFCKQGQWFIPTAKDLLAVRNVLSSVNDSLALLTETTAAKLAYSKYWSSNEYYSDKQYTVNMGSGTITESTHKSAYKNYLRPVLYYGGTKELTHAPILYGDGTVSKEILAGKTPVGIVVDESKRLAVALTDVKKNGSAGSEVMIFSQSYKCDLSLTNCSNSNLETCDIDGRANTNVILSATCGASYEAVNAVNNYLPSGCSANFCKKNKWYLPSVKELMFLGSNWYEVDLALSRIKSVSTAQLVENNSYWSSNETYNNPDWVWLYGNGGASSNGKSANYFVRPFVKY